MKLKLGEVYSLVRNLPKLTNKDIPIKISYRLLKLLKICSAEMDTLEKTRIKLVEKYAEKTDDDKKGECKVADENKEKFQEQFAKLLDEDVEIDFKLISIEDLGDINFSVNDLAPLQIIIKEK